MTSIPTDAELEHEAEKIQPWCVRWSRREGRRFYARRAVGSHKEIVQWIEPTEQQIKEFKDIIAESNKKREYELNKSSTNQSNDQSNQQSKPAVSHKRAAETDADNDEPSNKRARTNENQHITSSNKHSAQPSIKQPINPDQLSVKQTTFSNQDRFNTVLSLAKLVIAVNVFDVDEQSADQSTDNNQSNKQPVTQSSIDAEECYKRLMDPSIPLPAPPILSTYQCMDKSINQTITLLDEHPSLIAKRRLAFNRLDQRLQRLCREAGSRMPVNAFQRWGFSQRSIQRQSMQEMHESINLSVDPLLPINPGIDDALSWELERGKLTKAASQHVAQQIATECAAEAKRLLELKKQSLKLTVNYSSIEIQADVSRQGVQYIHVRYTGEGDASLRHDIRLNQTHFDKLQRLYAKHTLNESNWQSLNLIANDQFRHRLYCCLARYDTIAGAGYQAAMPETAFDYCADTWSVTTECFASPLNCYMPQFHSAFIDTDRYFGSRGSFFTLRADEGSYESNPPFLEEVMTPNAMFVLALLHRAEVQDKALMFVVVWPGWDDCAAYELLMKSPFLTEFIDLAASEHRYKEGFQHRAEFLYRQSVAKSFVFLMQTSAAKKKWPVTADQVQTFRQKFK